MVRPCKHILPRRCTMEAEALVISTPRLFCWDHRRLGLGGSGEHRQLIKNGSSTDLDSLTLKALDELILGPTIELQRSADIVIDFVMETLGSLDKSTNNLCELTTRFSRGR